MNLVWFLVSVGFHSALTIYLTQQPRFPETPFVGIRAPSGKPQSWSREENNEDCFPLPGSLRCRLCPGNICGQLGRTDRPLHHHRPQRGHDAGPAHQRWEPHGSEGTGRADLQEFGGAVLPSSVLRWTECILSWTCCWFLFLLFLILRECSNGGKESGIAKGLVC